MKAKIVLLMMMNLVAFSLFAQDAANTRKKHFNLENGIAIQGFDPVAYFKQNKSVKGSKEFSLYHEGVTYYFSNAENKDDFKKNPAKYEPQYGGWCAYAMGKDGSKVEVDPATFKIIDDKLFLFYNKFFNNTMKSWNKDESNLKKNADANWQNIYK